MMNRLVAIGIVSATLASWAATEARADVAACTEAETQSYLALPSDSSLPLACNLTLEFGQSIRAHLRLRTSGVTVDCGGGTLNWVTISSTYSNGAWVPVTDVTIKHCTVVGPVQLTGMGHTAHDSVVRGSESVLESSHREGHIERVRAAAPTRITLDDLVMIADGWTSLFVGPGVSYLSLTNSELKGRSAPGPGIYLDSEAHHNAIQNNYIHVDTKSENWLGLNQFREQIAVDNASSNVIINNSFAALLGGGVYLYRNCGEKRGVRHDTPHHNHIINNFFYYDTYDEDAPAIFVGSRTGLDRAYCAMDAAWPWGSGADDRSFARNNVVAQNQIRNRSVATMIKVGDSSNRPNYIDHNETVASQIYRQAGCYRADGSPEFVPDGGLMSVAGSRPNWSCTNHTLVLAPHLILTVL